MNQLRQRGAALLAAMLTVTLVATIAASALWQQWRSVEIEQADRTRIQSTWILTGALDWARLILREDFNADRIDTLSEPWAVPLQEARLSTFLAADQGNNMDATSDADTVFLSGEISDLQAKMNLGALVEAGVVKEKPVENFQRLFDVLGIPQSQLNKIVENMRFAGDISIDNRNGGRAALMPQRLEQLAWLGVPEDTIAALEPHVTILPSASTTQVNLNTASAEVIYAAGRNLSRNVGDAAKLVPAATFDLSAAAVETHYFQVRGRLRIGDVVIEERSMVQRNGTTVRTLQRERGSFHDAAPAPR
jgi:general secretion pathway protein K